MSMSLGGTHTPTDRYDAQQKIQWWSGADTEGRDIHSSWEGQRRFSERGARSLSRLGEESGDPALRILCSVALDMIVALPESRCPCLRIGMIKPATFKVLRE